MTVYIRLNQGSSDYIWLHQVRTVMSRYFLLGQVGQVRSVYIRLVQVRSGYDRLFQVRSGCVRFCQVSSV